MKPNVDNGLRDVIPALSEDERTGLRESIADEGCRDAITVWDEKNLVVDGHNRLAICDELGISYEVRRMSFASRDDAIVWMCGNNLSRRNLTSIARADLIGRRYNAMKQSQGRPAKECGQNDHIVSGRTEARLGDWVGVSSKGVRRAAKLSDALDAIEDAGTPRSEMTSGARKVKASGVIQLGEIAAKDPDKAKLVWEKVKDQGATGAAIKAAIRSVEGEEAVSNVKALTRSPNDLVTIEHGDFRDLAAGLEPESFDAIITDPPYPAEYLYTWDALSEVAMRVLKPGGWCITYTGKQHLDEVFTRMLSGGLTYFWQVVFLQTVSPAIHPRAVNTGYKPILIFQKPPLTKPKQYFRDVIKGERVEKGLHEWQQSEDGFAWLIETFTEPGQRILEPFLGGGTCAQVCKHLNRYCVGYEIDEVAYAQSVERVFDRELAA